MSSDSSDSERRQTLLQKAIRLYRTACTKANGSCLIGFVEHHRKQGEQEIIEDLLQWLKEEKQRLQRQDPEQHLATLTELLDQIQSVSG